MIFSDSSYVVNGITSWVDGWQQNGWKTKQKKGVLNKKLWEELVEISTGMNILWKIVPGHRAVAGNERADAIATEFADGNNPILFSGNTEDYPMDILRMNARKE